VVDAGAIAGDRGFDRRVETVVGDGQRRTRLVVAVGIERILACEGADVVVWCAGTG
jgi:hypothetical protein